MMSVDEAGPNRRRFKRVAAPVYCRPAGLRSFFEAGRAVNDISPGGIRLYSDEAFKVGARLELEVFLPDQTSVTVTARAVWVDNLPSNAPAAYDVGFEFVDISPRDHLRLGQILVSN